MKASLMEYDDEGVPIYLHAPGCQSFCDYACNGNKGVKAAQKQMAKDARTIKPQGMSGE